MKQMIDFPSKDIWRLGFHLMPVTGWLNDPNGLCFYDNYYHVFFQHSPDTPYGGIKHWGHYRSRDLLNWEFLGIPLSPEEAFESHGVYSGSAYVEDGIMHLFYTGNVKLSGDYDYIKNGRQGNTIHVSSKDGIIFEHKECLLMNQDYPSNLSCHVRDPKVWKDERNGDYPYLMILGARTMDDIGEVLIYQSKDLKQWSLVQEVTTKEPWGYMWECPDVFCVGNKQVLSISPQGISPEGFLYNNIYQTGYFIYEGSLTREYSLESFIEWDRGFDFYAPQSFEDAKGRRLMIGWMGMPDVPEHDNPTTLMGWQHALTIPRELIEDDKRILQKPVAELQALRKSANNLKSGEQSALLRYYEILINNEADKSFAVTFSKELCFVYDSAEKVAELVFSDGLQNIGRGRGSRKALLKNCRKIQVYVDCSSVELFINDGEEVFTTRFYPEHGKSFFEIDGDNCDVVYWELNSYSLESKQGIGKSPSLRSAESI